MVDASYMCAFGRLLKAAGKPCHCIALDWKIRVHSDG